jgi:hypothetical protein
MTCPMSPGPPVPGPLPPRLGRPPALSLRRICSAWRRNSRCHSYVVPPPPGHANPAPVRKAQRLAKAREKAEAAAQDFATADAELELEAERACKALRKAEAAARDFADADAKREAAAGAAAQREAATTALAGAKAQAKAEAAAQVEAQAAAKERARGEAAAKVQAKGEATARAEQEKAVGAAVPAAAVDLDSMSYFKLKKWIQKQAVVPKPELDAAFGKPEMLRLCAKYGLVIKLARDSLLS